MTTESGRALLKTERLRRLAALVPPCASMIDVGTDHGWLPIALVRAGVVERAIASDVLPDPLAIARGHIRAYRLGEVISARLGDGLATLSVGEAEVVTIAGMGLKSILAILAAHPPHMLGAHTLIVQTPQIDNRLRAIFTRDYPWTVTHEELLWEAPQVYHMLRVDLTRAQEHASWRDPSALLDTMISPYLQAHQDVSTQLRALTWLTHRKRLRLRGLTRAKSSPRPELIAQTRAELEELEAYAHVLETRQE